MIRFGLSFRTLFFAMLGTCITHYSSAQGQWCKKTSFPGKARHRCTAFSIGTKTYFGGGHINSGTTQTFSDYWQYDPATDSWTQIASYGGGERYHSVAFSLGDVAYVGAGQNGGSDLTSDFWKYVPLVNMWFPVADLPGPERRGSSSFVVNDVAYVGLGQSDFGYEADFYRYDPDSDTWTQIDSFIGSPRSGAVGFSNGDFGYIGTGHEFGAATCDFYSYNSMTDTWAQLADVDTVQRQDAAGFVLNGKGYILTGNDVNGDNKFNDVWEYDFSTGNWLRLGDFPGDGRCYFACCVTGNVAWCTGGTSGTNLRDHWMFDPTMSLGTSDKNVSTQIYPNPSSSTMRIDFDDVGTGENMFVEVTDLAGKKVLFGSLKDCAVLDRSLIGDGTFILSLHNDGKIVHASKIIFR